MMDDVKDYPPYLDYPKPRKTTTNADRIRAMSDDELSKWLCDHMNCGYCKWGYTGDCKLDEWLEQPAE